jgi:hypothetical protein
VEARQTCLRTFEACGLDVAELSYACSCKLHRTGTERILQRGHGKRHSVCRWRYRELHDNASACDRFDLNSVWLYTEQC